MIALLVGTRPELIKIAPVIRALDEKQLPFVLIHSNQHYSAELDTAIMDDLGLNAATYNLHVGSASHAVQTGKIMEGVEKICLEIKPNILVVHGDTNTTLGGALTAKKLQIPVAHIEAGLRSFDYRMPEEINRTLVDRISDVLFAPTIGAKNNLLHEGIEEKTIVVTGNTVVDAVNQHLELAKKSQITEKLTTTPKRFILLTLHRAENVDDKEKLQSLLALISHANNKLKVPVIWPIHPRTKQRLTEFGLSISDIQVIPPLGYIDMLRLMSEAALVMTDSGGIQEETYILHTPVVTLRTSTERPETLSANFIIDDDLQAFDQAWQAFQDKKVTWGTEFGDGTAAKKIVATLEKYL